MQAGKVDLLLILGGNPVYTAPADVPFSEALDKVQTRVRLGLYEDETSVRCQWQIPEALCLERWTHAPSYDHTASIVTPLIAPLYNGRTAHEVLSTLSERGARAPYE